MDTPDSLVFEIDEILQKTLKRYTDKPLTTKSPTSLSFDLNSRKMMLEDIAYIQENIIDLISLTHDVGDYTNLGLPDIPVIATDSLENVQIFFTYLSNFNAATKGLVAAINLKQHQKKFSDAIEKKILERGKSFHFEFTDGDLTKIQSLIDQLRKNIQLSGLQDKHKQRLLARLEAMQSELHKRMSNFDRFYAFVGDAGATLGQFGKDAKPFVDLIRDIMRIVNSTQSQAHQLESDYENPLIPLPDEEE